MTDYKPLLDWITAREAIRIRKDAGEPPPWTDDPIFQNFRFCNVRREDDRVTVWIRENIREPFATHSNLWLMLCIARQINWPDTLEEMITCRDWPLNEDFEPAWLAITMHSRKDRGDKVFTGAYITAAPHSRGEDKAEYIAETVIGGLWKQREKFAAHLSNAPTLQATHNLIYQSDGWGPFTAYQAVVDMRFTSLLDKAIDIDTWAAAGPGTIRGLNRLHGRALKSGICQEWALSDMREAYKAVRDGTDIRLDFSDIPNALCEMDKYQRVKLEQGRPRANYVPGRGA